MEKNPASEDRGYHVFLWYKGIMHIQKFLSIILMMPFQMIQNFMIPSANKYVKEICNALCMLVGKLNISIVSWTEFLVDMLSYPLSLLRVQKKKKKSKFFCNSAYFAFMKKFYNPVSFFMTPHVEENESPLKICFRSVI